MIILKQNYKMSKMGRMESDGDPNTVTIIRKHAPPIKTLKTSAVSINPIRLNSRREYCIDKLYTNNDNHIVKMWNWKSWAMFLGIKNHIPWKHIFDEGKNNHLWKTRLIKKNFGDKHWG